MAKKTTGVVKKNAKADKTETFHPVSNSAKRIFEAHEPYVARITLVGTARILFHAYNVESVKTKTSSKKGSDAKKNDDVDSYVYRVSEDDDRLGFPCSNFCRSMAIAAKSMQDPRSPRKSMMDLVTAAVLPLDEIAPFIPDIENWHFLDRRRAVVQHSGIPRERPGLHKGWQISFNVLVPPETLHKLATDAGTFQGIGDYRPTFGRFRVVNFETGLFEEENLPLAS